LTEPFWGVAAADGEGDSDGNDIGERALAGISLTPQKGPVKVNPQAGDWMVLGLASKLRLLL